MKRILLILPLTALAIAQPADRFDYKVRNLFFAGYAGDADSLAQGMKITEAVLKNEPKNAEAMVWHGGGVFFQANGEFQKQNFQKGMELFKEGTGMMDKAVELEPDSIGVRIPRGAAYLTASRFMPPQMGQPILEKGVKDYETSWNVQKDGQQSWSVHSLGELLFGIAEGNGRLGNKQKATEYFELIQTRLPDTAYAKRAAKWLAGGSLPAGQSNCIGCHNGSPKVQ